MPFLIANNEKIERMNKDNMNHIKKDILIWQMAHSIMHTNSTILMH